MLMNFNPYGCFYASTPFFGQPILYQPCLEPQSPIMLPFQSCSPVPVPTPRTTEDSGTFEKEESESAYSSKNNHKVIDFRRRRNKKRAIPSIA